MLRIKQLIILLLTAFILGGSVGVNVFKHICSKDGVSVTYLFNTNSHCEEEEQLACHAEASEVPACCQPEKKKEKDDCCSDEVNHYQLKIDYAPQENDVQQAFFIDIDLPPFIEGSSERTAPICLQNSNIQCADPPPLEASRYRSILQVYTI